MELRRADVLILNRAYDVVVEHNASRLYGPEAPNDTVATHFCLRGEFGSFLVYLHCRPRTMAPTRPR